jgi:biopolymer transport protein ExbD
MAFSLNGSSGGFGRSRFRGTSTLSEINVVPLVDVVLVLLIIFMLTAHVMETSLEVEVPHVKNTQDSTRELPIVTITKDGDSYLNDKPINIHLIGAEIQKRFGKSKAVYLKADRATNWDPIAQVIAALRDAQLAVSVVTQPEDETGKAAKVR